MLVTAGALAGALAGVALRTLVGRVDRRQVDRAVATITGQHARPATGRAVGRRIEEALAADGATARLAFEVVPVGPGHVELHGWVPTRAVRARAILVAADAVPGVDVTNRLQVEAEDAGAAAPPQAPPAA